MQKIYKNGLMALLVAGAFLPTMAENATGSNIYGFLGYTNISENSERNGWYAIDPDGEMNLLWHDDVIGITGSYFNIGWVKDGNLCGYHGNSSNWAYMEFDIHTGKLKDRREIDIKGENSFRLMLAGAYNPDDGYVYGFSFNSDYSTDYFVKAPAGRPEMTEIIREMPQDFIICKSLCYNYTDQHFYGIDSWNGLIRFDVYGNFEFITDVDLTAPENMGGWNSGMCFSPKDNAFFWNAQYSTFDSDLVRIDPKTYHCDIVKEYPWQDLLTVLVCYDTDGTDNGPVAPTMKNYGIEGTSTSGTITYVMPTALANNTEGIPSELTWTATELPGGQTQTGTAAPGDDVTVEWKDLSTGEHTFSFYATAGEDKGASLFTNTWVGPDKPYVPEKVEMKEVSGNMFQVTWEPVKKGAHNGSIDMDGIQYAVFLNGVQKLITKECKAEIEFDGEAPNEPYQASVVAFYGDQIMSEAGMSNILVAGAGYPLPYVITPTADEAKLMTYINVDNDRSGWRYDTSWTPSFYTGRDYDNPGNDWLITPKLVFPTDAAVYTIEFEACVYNDLYNEEFFNIWCSQENTLEGMLDIKVAEHQQVTLKSWEPFKFDFEVDAAGGYYIGIQSVSNADMMGWYIRNIIISMKQNESVESVNLLANVKGGQGEIIVNGLEGNEIEVYGADGVRYASMKSTAYTENIPVMGGIYIVKAGGKSWKVAVR